jgi:DNA polymerase I-like protein with 3'-5' exonuclease and polymerase domains
MVHDEIVLEVQQGREEHWGELLKTSMESAGAEICSKVPIVAEVSWGPTWADAK